MQRGDLDEEWDQPEAEPAVDFDRDEVVVRGVIDVDLDLPPESTPKEVFPSDESAARVRNAEFDERLVEFVDLLNARDLDGLLELLDPEVEADFLEASSPSQVADGLEDLVLRYPTLVVTRGDLGEEPIVAAWLYDDEGDCYDLVGYFAFELSEWGDRLIQRVEYIDEVADTEDLVVETPEKAELPEWEDWTAYEEG